MPATTKLVLYVIDGDPDNEEAKRLVDSLDQEVVVERCTPSMDELFDCPFVRDEEGGGYFRIEGIQRLIQIRGEKPRETEA